tara:strand:- start:292 stop:573 length:282 start_codon:yes stop_codon:yes gene_type:complete
MLIKMQEKQVRNWFGDRGYPFDDNSKLRYKVLKVNGNTWIFIHDSKDEYDEVELYYMNTSFCEPYGDWQRKGFSWAKNNLIKLIKELEENKYE